jgi:hypothetical protein
MSHIFFLKHCIKAPPVIGWDFNRWLYCPHCQGTRSDTWHLCLLSNVNQSNTLFTDLSDIRFINFGVYYRIEWKSSFSLGCIDQSSTWAQVSSGWDSTSEGMHRYSSASQISLFDEGRQGIRSWCRSANHTRHVTTDTVHQLGTEDQSWHLVVHCQIKWTLLEAGCILAVRFQVRGRTFGKCGGRFSSYSYNRYFICIAETPAEQQHSSVENKQE